MKVYDAQSLRNVALVGHSGAGKTQLLSALLFDAGAVNRLGRVDEGTTVTDYDEEEIARKHTLSASLAYVEWNRTKINFIDTPGMANFLSDARAALRVVGCRARRRRRRLRRAGLDREGVEHRRRDWRRRASSCSTGSIASAPASSRALDSLRGVFGRTVIPDPDSDRRGEGLPRRRRSRGDEGVDVRRPTAAARRPRRRSRPTSQSAAQTRARRAHRDGRGSRRCADGEVLRVGNADAGRAGRGPQARASPPAASSRCVCTSATANIGMQPLLDAILSYVPSPAERPFAATAKGIGGQRRGQGRRQRAGGGVRVEDRRRSVRRTHHDVPRHLRHGEGGLDGAEHHRARRPSGSAT